MGENLILEKTYEISKLVTLTLSPEYLGLVDVIWEPFTEILKKWIEKDPIQWPLGNLKNKPMIGLGLTGPEELRLSVQHIMLLVPAVLANLLTHEGLNSDEVQQKLSYDLKIFGKMFSVPPYLVQHLEKTLPELLLQIPEGLADTETCWKVLPGKEKEKITIKQARILPFKTPEYFILINMLRRRPVLYVDGKKLDVGQKGVEVLICLLKKNGEVCRYEEIIEAVWARLVESLSPDEWARYVARLEKAVNGSLKKASPELKENILNVPDVGYKVKGDLLKYCIIEK